jgi:hypothetical protein
MTTTNVPLVEDRLGWGKKRLVIIIFLANFALDKIAIGIADHADILKGFAYFTFDYFTLNAVTK